jgi:hypothetical protein
MIMKAKLKYILGTIVILLLVISSCTEDTYSLGELTAPSNVVIDAEIVGQDASHPDGDSSGDVKFTITGENILGVKIDFDDSDGNDTFTFLPKGTTTKKYTKNGLNTYRAIVVVAGAGGTTTTLTKEVSVRFDFDPGAEIVTNLTNNASKTWIVDKSVPGHFGVGPWEGCFTPCWWSAGINEKVNCCNCFYTTTFTFKKDVASGLFSLQVVSPDGAFTKTGALAGGLPGIPSSGEEACYTYAGGTSEFAFLPATTGIPASTPSTQVSILLSGVNTFIGYGAVQKDYEILELRSDYMYLRVRGTETGNSWYLKLIPAP